MTEINTGEGAEHVAGRYADKPQDTDMENYVIHNGDFEFYKVIERYYDMEVVQWWLEGVLPVLAAVDSGVFMDAPRGLYQLRRLPGVASHCPVPCSGHRWRD